jgi:hypothetical protein
VKAKKVSKMTDKSRKIEELIILNFYQPIPGITGHQGKNKEICQFSFTLFDT